MILKKWLRWMLISLSALILLSGCANSEESADKTNQSGIKNGESDTKEANSEKQQPMSSTGQPIELSSYAKEIGATLSNPESKEFAVQSSFMLEGVIEEVSGLNDRFIWVELYGPQGGEFTYYVPVKDGKFSEKIKLFEGKGEYDITVRLPDKSQDNHFYEMTSFQVENESSKTTRDIFIGRKALENGLTITQPASGLTETEGFLHLEGTIDNTFNGKNLMVKGEKGSESWKLLVPVKNGGFETEIPLHYGGGKHKVTVMVPDPNRENYYLEAAKLFAKNTSSAKTEPIKFYRAYHENEFQLDYPKAGGKQADSTFRIAGTYDSSVSDNKKIEQVIVTTKKGDLEASYLVPAANGKFEGQFWLRFGPGEYEVTVNIPTDPGAYKSYFRYTGIASFTVKSNAKDKRELLPSRGIQSDSQNIKDLAANLTKRVKSERKQAKAIYDYVAKNITYDVGKLENDLFKLSDSALKTLKTKSGVCQDYAFLTVALLRAADIESHYISGRGNLARHAWVEANINGKWVLMDPTWGAGYVQDGKFVPHYNDKYFDPNLKAFKKNHTREEIVY
ncbi:transglutaminase domain-containing protein [Virgibacillus siamensis]|uniref:transglutaminase domain-containing protein n=1 Tax=Virgibacillus siamensis TaxID=480071 RepID=UPI000986B6BC|nr:transglutaminase-like domain-containing protein [Virgibacillus siamensis]